MLTHIYVKPLWPSGVIWWYRSGLTWVMKWLVAWRHQAITWPNVDLTSEVDSPHKGSAIWNIDVFCFHVAVTLKIYFSHSLNKQSSGLDIGCELAQKWTLQNLTNEQSTLVQAMHWYRQAQTISWAKLCNVNHNANIIMFYILSRHITHFQLHSPLALVQKDQCISEQLFQLNTLIPIK